MSAGAMDRKKGADPMAATMDPSAAAMGGAGSKKKDLIEGVEGFEAQEKKLAPTASKEQVAPPKGVGMA